MSLPIQEKSRRFNANGGRHRRRAPSHWSRHREHNCFMTFQFLISAHGQMKPSGDPGWHPRTVMPRKGIHPYSPFPSPILRAPGILKLCVSLSPCIAVNPPCNATLKSRPGPGRGAQPGRQQDISRRNNWGLRPLRWRRTRAGRGAGKLSSRSGLRRRSEVREGHQCSGFHRGKRGQKAHRAPRARKPLKISVGAFASSRLPQVR